MGASGVSRVVDDARIPDGEDSGASAMGTKKPLAVRRLGQERRWSDQGAGACCALLMLVSMLFPEVGLHHFFRLTDVLTLVRDLSPSAIGTRHPRRGA